jgi:hypothetical protein
MEFSPAARSVSTRPLPKDCSTVNYGSDEKAPAWFSPSAGWRELRRCARSPGCHRPPDAVALRSAQRMGPARSDHQAVAAYAFGSFLASHQVAPPCLGEESPADSLGSCLGTANSTPRRGGAVGYAGSAACRKCPSLRLAVSSSGSSCVSVHSLRMASTLRVCPRARHQQPV